MSLQDFLGCFRRLEDTTVALALLYTSLGSIDGPSNREGKNDEWVNLIQIPGNQSWCLRVTSQHVCGNTPPWKRLGNLLNLQESQTVIVHRGSPLSSLKIVGAPPVLPSVAVYSEKAQRTVVSLLALAFRSSYRFSQAFMRWLSLSSEVQLSFESMVPWLPPPPTPWFPEELPQEPSAN